MQLYSPSGLCTLFSHPWRLEEHIPGSCIWKRSVVLSQSWLKWQNGSLERIGDRCLYSAPSWPLLLPLLLHVCIFTLLYCFIQRAVQFQCCEIPIQPCTKWPTRLCSCYSLKYPIHYNWHNTLPSAETAHEKHNFNSLFQIIVSYLSRQGVSR